MILLTAVPTSWFVALASVLFILGAVGFALRRNALIMFMSIELMLNAANVTFVAFAREHKLEEGVTYALIVIAVAAAEVAVGLAIIIAIFRLKQTVDVDEVRELRG
jgi:NADH-quinone oxidoreductase subunit K